MRTAKFTKQFTISLNADLFNNIKKISDKDKMSMAEVLRDIIDRGMEALEMEDEMNE